MQIFNYEENEFKDLCRKYGLLLVILHGSYAKGLNTPQSDIDVALLGDSKAIKDRFFDIIGDFSKVFGENFDPCFLNRAEAMITYHVAMDGRPLYEKTKGLFNAFKLAALSRYQDTKKFRLLEKAYVKSAIYRGAQ